MTQSEASSHLVASGRPSKMMTLVSAFCFVHNEICVQRFETLTIEYLRERLPRSVCVDFCEKANHFLWKVLWNETVNRSGRGSKKSVSLIPQSQ